MNTQENVLNFFIASLRDVKELTLLTFPKLLFIKQYSLEILT